MRIPNEASDLLRGDALATVVTLDPDGTPQITVAWVGLDGDEIVIATMPDQRKLHNLHRDPRIAIAVHAMTRSTAGLTEYLVLYGRARVTEGGAPELLQELANTYIGPHVKFPTMPNPPPGFVTRVTVERIGGVGPWASGGP